VRLKGRDAPVVPITFNTKISEKPIWKNNLCTKRFQNFPAIQVAWDSNFTNTHKSHVQLKTIERNYELDGESTNALIEKQKN
jgi:hypothetical protein